MRRLPPLLILTLLLSSIFVSVFPKSAVAVSGSDWKAGRIIDDSVFTNVNSMSVTDIQNFLNSKVPACDTNGTQPATEYGRSDLTHAQYAATRGWGAPPYVCLRNYYEVPKTSPSAGIPDNSYNHGGGAFAGGVSAAQLIYNAAQEYQINPKVLLVKLHTESAGPLTTDTWPLQTQYTYAMGAHCPDSGPGGSANCDSNYAGFSIQIAESAALLRWYLDSMTQSWWQYKKPYQVNSILWNVSQTGCGAGNVYIESKATAALYTYTPYQPNAAALANLYGTGDGCSAYGNRNFWRIFSDWFGPTTGSGYSWSIQSFTYSGGDNVLIPGDPETATLKVTNTSRYPWYNHGNHPVRLATWEPADSAGKLYAPGWLSNNRAATLQENSVAPGETGTFVFPVSVSSPGTFYQSFNLVAENATFMDWPGFRPTVVGSAPYRWNVDNVVYGNGTGLMKPNAPQLITVIARNTGTATWSKSTGPAIKLATWQPDRQSQANVNWLSKTRVAYMNETAVAPGQTAGFQFWVQAPSAGYFYERLNLVAEGQSWFNDTRLTLYLKGGSYSWQPIWTSLSTGSTTVSRGSNFTITVRAKNTGDYAWSKTSGPKIRFGTSSPYNRGSHLYSPSWISDTRATELIENTVSPGQEGTFSFTATMPNTLGKYTEQFNLVAEGESWFQSPDVSFVLNAK